MPPWNCNPGPSPVFRTATCTSLASPASFFSFFGTGMGAGSSGSGGGPSSSSESSPRRRTSLVIHLSSPSPSYEPDPTHTESEFDPGQFSDASAPSMNVGTISRRNESRQYTCSFEGCTKSYKKPSRLEEHERSHTGTVTPYTCSACNKSYLRESHLQAHARVHLPDSARPFACEHEGCGKRFWTSQHLRVHTEQHRGEKAFKCTEQGCDQAFAKHHQLRDHVASVHSPPGTKPYKCTHSGCTKSFATNQKLNGHQKTHDDKRYTCTHQSCLPASGTDPTYYATWSALQHHTRTVHPPTCPYPSCNGKTFSQQKGLRAHLKIHAQRDQEAALDATATTPRPRKKRRGGEVGRDWVCDVEGCTKDFKSKKALATHDAVAHLKRRDFVCPHAACARAFGYKHLLQRHLAKLHAPSPNAGTEAEEEAIATAAEADTEADAETGIDLLTGKAYASRAAQAHKLRCPHPHLPPLLSPTSATATAGGSPRLDEPAKASLEEAGTAGARKAIACQYMFSRAYDLHRHLRAEHSVIVERERVEVWVRREKEGKS
ncbi:uncharacterized protein BXZ73DRAFT_87378 [Epithele typhae]|uniref:uncharacterized protein n=1 Tax=Epithele typhae TaxID=378194 RepID=UPI00200765FA|nr:uncharacterized protein BXZ73DRAFT_87378 [Epithele typhae]KAH9944495.1 hypothetical protein BXZ73DRAFT_87378 [Epithele typhae]